MNERLDQYVTRVEEESGLEAARPGDELELKSGETILGIVFSDFRSAIGVGKILVFDPKNNNVEAIHEFAYPPGVNPTMRISQGDLSEEVLYTFSLDSEINYKYNTQTRELFVLDLRDNADSSWQLLRKP